MREPCMRCDLSGAYGDPCAAACEQCLEDQDKAAEEKAEEERGRAEMAADDEYARKRDERVGHV